MKAHIVKLALLCSLPFMAAACNSAKKAEAEKKRTQDKMEQLEKDKQQFERQNQKEIK